MVRFVKEHGLEGANLQSRTFRGPPCEVRGFNSSYDHHVASAVDVQ